MLDLVIACLLGVSMSFALILIFKIIRANFHVKVTCWFCDRSTSVPFGNRNCWDCPFCEQYNGFTRDGDYNKAIPAQWTAELNHPISCKKQEFIPSSNGLCAACNERQLLKMQQLTAFKPFIESNYSKEVNDYKDHLEKIYSLCYKCNMYVHQELERQDLALKLRCSQNQNNSSLSSSASYDSKNSLPDVDPPVKKDVNQWCSYFTGFLSCLLAGFLVFVNLGEMQSSLAFKLQLPPLALNLLEWLTSKKTGIALSGLFLCLTSKFLWVGRKSLYLSDVICCMIWFLQSLLSVLLTFGMVSKMFLPTLQSASPLVSLISIFFTIFSYGCSRNPLPNKKWARPSYSHSSISSLQSSISSQKAESVQSFNSSDSLYSCQSNRTKFTPPNKSDSSFSSSFSRPFLHNRTSSGSFSHRDTYTPLSVKSDLPFFPHVSVPSFKSLSQASSLNGDFASGQFSSKSLFNHPVSSISPSLFLTNNKTRSDFKRGPRSLNGSFTSLRESRKTTPPSLADKILGLKMNKITLGSSSIARSHKSMSDANLSLKSTHSSPSPSLSRGEIAPARLSVFNPETDHLSSNRTFPDRDSLFSSSNFLNDTGSVHSDNFSVRSCSSRKSRHQGGESPFSSSNNLRSLSKTNLLELDNDTDDSKDSSTLPPTDALKYTQPKKTGSKCSIATLLIISVFINILLILFNMERISLPITISKPLSIFIVSFKKTISSLSLLVTSWLSL